MGKRRAAKKRCLATELPHPPPFFFPFLFLRWPVIPPPTSGGGGTSISPVRVVRRRRNLHLASACRQAARNPQPVSAIGCLTPYWCCEPINSSITRFTCSAHGVGFSQNPCSVTNSLHSGFRLLMSASFSFLFIFFICFSRRMAEMMSGNSSKNTQYSQL